MVSFLILFISKNDFFPGVVIVPTQLVLLPPIPSRFPSGAYSLLALNATRQTRLELHIKFDFAQAPSEGVRSKTIHFSGDFVVVILGAWLSHLEYGDNEINSQGW